MSDVSRGVEVVQARAWESVKQALEQRRQAEAAALAELEADVVIDCIDCGSTIPMARLRACPQTRRCMPCASDQEV